MIIIDVFVWLFGYLKGILNLTNTLFFYIIKFNILYVTLFIFMKVNKPWINPDFSDFMDIFYIEEDWELKFNINTDNNNDLTLLLDVFLKKVYWSFYLFWKNDTKNNTLEIIWNILHNNSLIDSDWDLLYQDWKKIEYKGSFVNFNHVVLDCVSHFKQWSASAEVKWISYDIKLLKYVNSFIFPFLHLEKTKMDTSKANFSDKNHDNLEDFLLKFQDKEYWSIYVLNLENYVLVFCKFEELLSDDLIMSISNKFKLEFLWLQTIIPSYINRLQKKLDKKDLE